MTKRFFLPGMEWLYIKLYTGCVNADNYIINIIRPLSDRFKSQGLITQYFFIRYQDPEFHIRIRYNITSASAINLILKSIYEFFSADLECGVISKVQLDTYKREIERYGDVLMEETECLFSIDSTYTCDLLSILYANGNKEIDRLLMSLHSTNLYLDAFGFDTIQKKEIMRLISNSFIYEFRDKYDIKKINSLYQSYKRVISSFMFEKNTSDSPGYFSQLYSLQMQRKEEISNVAQRIMSKTTKKTINQTMSSYIHMMNNRLFVSHQREYELVSYTCLYKFYDSMVAQKIDF